MGDFKSFEEILKPHSGDDLGDNSFIIKATKRRKRNTIIAYLVGFALIAGLVFLVVNYYVNSKLSAAEPHKPIKQVAKIVEAEETEDVKEVEVKDLPVFADMVKNAPLVTEREIVVVNEGSVFTTSSDFKLNLTGAEVEPPASSCKVQATGDFCLAGIAKVKDLSYSVFFLNDGTRNALLRNVGEVKELPRMNNALFTGVFDLTIDGNASKSLLNVNPDGSGWLIIPADGGDVETLSLIGE